jgi:hypothetical protein
MGSDQDAGTTMSEALEFFEQVHPYITYELTPSLLLPIYTYIMVLYFVIPTHVQTNGKNRCVIIES